MVQSHFVSPRGALASRNTDDFRNPSLRGKYEAYETWLTASTFMYGASLVRLLCQPPGRSAKSRAACGSLKILYTIRSWYNQG